VLERRKGPEGPFAWRWEERVEELPGESRTRAKSLPEKKINKIKMVLAHSPGGPEGATVL